MSRRLHHVLLVLVPLALLLAACGGGGSDSVAEPPAVVTPIVEVFPVAPVLRQLAGGYTFTGSAPNPATAPGFPTSVSVTYASTGPGKFERRQTSDSQTETWKYSFEDAGTDGSLRFKSPLGYTYVDADFPLIELQAMPASAAPDATEQFVFPLAPCCLLGPKEQILFKTDPMRAGAFQWVYQWRLTRLSATRAELCLALHGWSDFSAFTNMDCFEINQAGQIQKARAILRSRPRHLPDMVQVYQ